MKNIISIYVFFILVSCSTQRLAISTEVKLSPTSNCTRLRDKCEVKVDYRGVKDQTYEFEVHIINRSKDSIFISPATFKYNTISENGEKDPIVIYSINPEKRIKQLKAQKDSLIHERNPYSLAGKGVKEIVTGGLVTGIIAVAFNQDIEKLESQRLEDEYWWDEHHSLQLNKVNDELDFWNGYAFMPHIISPSSEICGIVLFPTAFTAKEIELIIPIQNDACRVRFNQSN